MGVVTTYSPTGPMYEYTGQVNFSLSASGQRWQVMTVVPISTSLLFMKGFVGKNLMDLFRFKEESLKTAERIALVFTPVVMTNSRQQDARRELLRYLTKMKLPIVWKEGHHGYDINRSGRINRKWKLDSVWSVPARDT